MALTAAKAALMTKEALDDLGSSLLTAVDGDRTIGDFTYPLDLTLLDMALDSIDEATSKAEERCVLQGMQYYSYLRLFRKFAARASSQQGAGASGMHLQVEWSSTAKTLRMHVDYSLDRYREALKALGLDVDINPDVAGTSSQAVTVDRDEEVGEAILTHDGGLPWFTESEWEST